MKKIIWLIFVLSWGSVCATGTPTFNLQDLERHFLESNQLLLAQKTQVKQAETLVAQERVWHNPSLSISEWNLWSNSSAEQLPYLFGRHGNTQQISAELEQLIETAGKRKKRISIKKMEQQLSETDYEHLILKLKKVLRQTFYELQNKEQLKQQQNVIIDLFNQMYERYQKQVELGNVPMADFFRVQTERMQLQSELAVLKAEQYYLLKELRILTGIQSLTLSQIEFNKKNDLQLSRKIPLSVKQLLDLQNTEIKQKGNELKMAKVQWKLQKSMRVPDLNFQVNYDRGGNIMRDFVGIGLQFDVPVFNKNKAAIKAAELEVKEQNIKLNLTKSQIENSLDQLLAELIHYEATLKEWSDQPINQQRKLLENYHKHLQNKQITLLEFIDFVQAFSEARKVYFEMEQKYFKTFEELQYLVGMDF